VDESKKKMNTGAYGIDLGMGKLGGPSPIRGRNITDDSSCGHLYIYESNVTNLGSFFNPEKYKVMMIGIEACYSGNDLFGSSHGTGQEQNGTGVGIYWHQNMTGKNRNCIGMDNLPGGNEGPAQVPAKYGGMVVRNLAPMDHLRVKANEYARSGWSGLLRWVPADHQHGEVIDVQVNNRDRTIPVDNDNDLED
jgi:hypothetical protein